MYIKKFRDMNGLLNFSYDGIILTDSASDILKKTYTQDDLWLGQVDLLQVQKFVQDNVEKIVYKVLS